MEIINPNEIGSKISTLISESTKFFYAVTAFIQVSDWKKMKTNLSLARTRGITIKFFVRDIKNEDQKTLEMTGVEVIQIPGLHTKMFFNEKEVIVTSMNLYEFSDLHSIDIALHYRDTESYLKLYSYFYKYIESIAPTNQNVQEFQSLSNLALLQNALNEKYRNTKVNKGSNYLFSENLLLPFHVFIKETEISLKYPNIKPSDGVIEFCTTKLSVAIAQQITPNKPTETYSFHTWDIKLRQQTQTEVFDMINKIKQIDFTH